MNNTPNLSVLLLAVAIASGCFLGACQSSLHSGVQQTSINPAAVDEWTATPIPTVPGIQLPTPWETYAAQTNTNSMTDTIDPISTEESSPPLAAFTDSNPSEGVLLTIKGESRFREFEVSPSGSTIALTEEHGVFMLEASSFDGLWFWQSPDRLTAQAVFSLNGELLATGAADASVTLLDSESGEALQVLHGQAIPRIVSFSQDGQFLYSISDEGAAWRWDLASGQETFISDPENLYAAPLLLSEHHGLLHAIDTNFTGIWDTSNNLDIHAQSLRLVHSVDLSPDQSILALATTPVTLWDVECGKLLNRMDQVRYSYTDELLFAPDGKSLVFGTFFGSIYLWDLEKDEPQRILPQVHGDWGDLVELAFSPDGAIVYAAYQPPNLFDPNLQNWLIAWDIENHKELLVKNMRAPIPLRASLSSEGAKITSLVHSKGLTLETWLADADSGSYTRLDSIDLAAWECVPTLNYVHLSEDGRRLASRGSSCNEGINIWDVATGEVVNVIQADAGVWDPFELSADGSYLFSFGGPTDVALWDVDLGTKVYNIPNVNPDVHFDPTTSPDGHTFAFGEVFGEQYLYSIESETRLHTLKGQRGVGVRSTFSPDGTRLASGGIDRIIMLWDVQTGERIRWAEQEGIVLDLAYLPDGSTLVTTSHGKIFFWDAETLALLGELEGHHGKVTLLGFSPDGRTMLTKGHRSTMILWDLRAVLGQGG